MNKRAQIFEGLLVFVVLGTCLYATYAMLSVGDKFNLSMNLPKEIANISKESVELDFFLQEEMKVIAEQAYYEAATIPGDENCIPYSYNKKQYVLLDGQCKPTGLFEENYRKIFADAVKDKDVTYTLNFSDNITLDYEKQFYKEINEKIVNYTINRIVKGSLIIDYTDDFLAVYNELMEKADRKKAVLDNWEVVSVETSGNYDYVSLISNKEHLFYDNSGKFEKIMLNIALTS